MKKCYSSPELEIEKFYLNANVVCSISDGTAPGGESEIPGGDYGDLDF